MKPPKKSNVTPLRDAKRAAGEVPPPANDASPVEAAGGGGEDAGDYTQLGLTYFFTKKRGQDWRYCHVWRAWLRWTGSHWQRDRVIGVWDDMLALLPDFTEEASKREKQDLRDRSTISGAEALARPLLPSVPEDWDTDPWLLATPGATFDLRTGVGRPARREDLISRCTAVEPDFGADCPTWRAVIHRAMGGPVEGVSDPAGEARAAELHDYLQRLFGYCLTGSTREQMLGFWHGGGGNGKGTLLNLFVWLMGGYAKVASFESFAETRGERHPTDLADLQGARLVVAQEVDAGRRWAETRVKALTGGDKISARFMRGDFFEYMPQFTLIIAGNHKPSLRDVDEAFRRRFQLLPFNVTIPASERDPMLADKLRSEAGAILAWAIEGARLWSARGLAVPAVVREATDAYMAEQDELGSWLEECCIVGGNWEVEAARLFGSWEKWAVVRGLSAGTAKAFADRLWTRGFDKKRKNTGMVYLGIQLASETLEGGEGDAPQ